MARILVTGDHGSVAGRDALDRIVQRMREDGHDAFVYGTQDEDVEAAVRGCDAVVGVLDRIEAGGAALTAYAHAQQKPVLGLTGNGASTHDVFREIADVREGSDVEAWIRHLPEFYDRIRPFAGRVVRDRIPELVREAGHDVTFRRLADDEKPRFLKQKVANEAQELARAEIGGEKEEVADVLEALEAFILARGFDRDDLRRIKEGKRKRRGGFTQAFVVESTARGGTDNEAAPDETSQATDEADGEAPEAEAPHESASGKDPTEGPEPAGFEYDDVEPEPVDEPDNLAPDRKVESRFFEL